MIRIDNARVFDGERLLDGVSVAFSDGRFLAVEAATRESAAPADEVIDGTGHTLLPGLIDAHTHVFGTLENLKLALAFGVTTEIDMFCLPPELTNQLCDAAADRDDVADMRSSGIVVCPPGGHPANVWGEFMPTLAGPHDAAAFVADRQKEGSHFSKVMFDDGVNHGVGPLPKLDRATGRAVATAAREAGLLSVAHICDVGTAEDALDCGIDALTHVPLEAPLPDELARRAAAHGRFAIPTLAMMEMSSGESAGRALLDDERVAAYLPAEARAAIKTGNEGLPVSTARAGHRFSHALASARKLHEAGVPLLAGTDANNAPGRACPVVHGAALHRELELLVAVGLSPAEALTAATAAPARLFGLLDRGRISPGLRADLVMVKGDPTVDITATRDIRGIWRRGVPFDRGAFRVAVA